MIARPHDPAAAPAAAAPDVDGDGAPAVEPVVEPAAAGRRRPERIRTLRQQLAITLATSGAVLLIVVTGAVYSLVQVVTLQHRVTHTYVEALTFSDALLTWLDDGGPAVDTFLATGYRPALEAYLAAPEDQARAARDALVEDFGDDHEMVQAVRHLLGAAQEWRTTFADPSIALVEAGGPRAVESEELAAGDVLFSEIRAEAGELADQLAASRALAAEELSEWTRNLFLTVVLLTVAALAVGLGVWFTLRRRILEPLAELAAKSQEVSEGALTQAVRTQAPGEIASLAHAVDTMRVELVAQMAAATESAKEIAEAHQHLSEQAEELRRSNRDLEQFAYVASHDLQEPLRKVASFTQLLQKRYGGELDDRADQYIEFAVDGAKRMQRLIQDLLGFSRVGRSLGDPVPVDLGEACRSAVATLEATIEAEGAVVEVGELPTVPGHQTLLVQLFQNLLGNALKFRDPDRPPRVEVGARRVEAGWELWCSDNGIGIDAQYADRVFVIFQRLHAKDVYDGTGIGLALCKKIVEFHAGEIWVDAGPAVAPGAPGTTVRWTLPDLEDMA